MNIMQQKAIERLSPKGSQLAQASVDYSRPVYVLTPEVILYDVQDVISMTGYSKKTVLKLFSDPELPKLRIGKKTVVEAHAFIAYCATTHDKDEDDFWRDM